MKPPSPAALAALSIAMLALPVGLGADAKPGAGAGSSAPGAAAVSPAAAPGPLPGDLALPLVPDSAELRAEVWEDFFAAPKDRVLKRTPSVRSTPRGEFRLSALPGEGAWYLVVAPRRGMDFPLYVQGSWIVKKDARDGSFLQAKVFLRSDPGCFIRIYPEGERSRLDLVLYGAVLKRQLPIGLPFATILRSPLALLLDRSAESVDWSLFSPRHEDSAGLRRLAAELRTRLPGLAYADDGALDAAGRPVFIANGLPQGDRPGLNCSGFAKWLVDGLRGRAEGAWLDPRALAARGEESRGTRFTQPYETLLDPWFGLDWTRNLAAALARSRDPAASADPEALDVELEAFALLAKDSGDAANGGSSYETYPAREEDLGYEPRGLKALLYLLALRAPDTLYLGSVSKADPEGIRRHYHVAAFLPYFEAGGEFRVAVFESGAETSLEAFVARTRGQRVHLVALEYEDRFEPPPFPSAMR